METLLSPKSPAIVWTTFYAAFLRDISKDLPDSQSDVDSSELSCLNRRFGEKLYYQLFPQLGKLLDMSLSSNTWLELPVWMRPYRDTDGYPRLLNRFWRTAFVSCRRIVFGEMVDSLLPRLDVRDIGLTSKIEAAAYAVYVLRQAFLAFSKIEDIEPDVDSERELTEFVDRITQVPQITDFSVIPEAAGLIRLVVCHEEELFGNGSPDSLAACLEQWESDPFGLHGPGAVANGEVGRQKWDFQPFEGLDEKVYQYFLVDPHSSDDFVVDWVSDDQAVRDDLQRVVNRMAVLAIVPKDFRGHRLICIEPKELQFAQQGLMRVLYQHLESHFLTRKAIRFSTQKPSQDMCSDIGFATLDLKDASDRLSIALSRLLFPSRFFRLMTRYRSNSIWLPDGRIVRSRALATMGSALCFPLETLSFWAISLAAMLKCDGHSYSDLRDPILCRKLMRRYRLRVFGDDIIVPRRYANCVSKALEGVGLIINKGKTCIDGLARESCGAWRYGGRDVSIVRFKTSEMSSFPSWLGLAENCKAFSAAGLHHTAQAILELCSTKCPLPSGASGLPDRRVQLGLRWLPASRANLWTSSRAYRWNKDLQRVEFRMPTATSSSKLTDLPDGYGLYAYFVGKSATQSPMRLGDVMVEWRWVALT